MVLGTTRIPFLIAHFLLLSDRSHIDDDRIDAIVVDELPSPFNKGFIELIS